MFGPIMSRTSKRTPILVGFPVRIVATLALLFFSYEGSPFSVILALSFVIGLGMAASTVSIYAILTDMADVDELITTINRPGVCSGMATFIRKISTGLSTFLIGLMLSAINYDELLAAQKMRQCASVQMGIVYIYVFSQIILLLITLFVTWKFPMGKKEFEIIVREVQRRKGEEHSTITEDEKRICEKVTGFKYENLWDKNNALRFKNN
jgi:oligogalacturonide transporter